MYDQHMSHGVPVRMLWEEILGWMYVAIWSKGPS